MKEKCLIVDGNNLLHSSYHVSQKLPWKMKQGTIFFFLRVLISILKKGNYQKLLIVFDGGGTNWRENFLPEYKAQRVSMPEELYEQMKVLKSLLEKIKLSSLQLVDCEGDDIIASFIQQIRKTFPETVFDVFTRDKDMLQLINSNTNILKYIDGKITLYTEEHFQQEYSFSPSNYVDYLSLMGDNIDNVEGVRGIGPVGARKLIQQFGTVEKIYQKISELPENTQKLLENSQETVLRNKKIITLVSDIPLSSEKYQNYNFCWEKWKNNAELHQFCQINNFKSVLKLLESD